MASQVKTILSFAMAIFTCTLFCETSTSTKKYIAAYFNYLFFSADHTSMISIPRCVSAVVWCAGQVFEVATGGATVAYPVAPGGVPSVARWRHSGVKWRNFSINK